MGNLSNLYISESFISLIHIGTNGAATSTPTELQDGLGNGIGVYVNTAGALSASVFSGSVAGIGNVTTFSSSVDSRINALSTSVDTRLDSLEFKDGTFTTTSSFNSFTSSYYTDSASFSSRINAITASGGIPAGTVSSSAQIVALGFATTASVDALSTSVDSRLDSLEAFSSSADSIYVNVSETSSMAVSSSLYAVTASHAIITDTASVARNVVIIARNGNQSTLNAGTIVHITSASGDNPIFNTASYDNEALSSNTLGVLRTSAASGADVDVLVNGIVTGVNTDPALGYVAGDIIYLSSSGQFTRVQPQAPLQIVTLGQVLRAQQNNGSIYVSINNGWELNELHNVQINTPATNDLLAYESSSYGLWKNKTITDLGLATTASLNSYTSSTNSRLNSIEAKTGSFATTGSNSFTGSQSISGSLSLTGSVAGNVTALTVASSTASIDFSLGSFFTLTIPSSSITYITGSNLKAGTTANIIMTQQSTTGSVRFESSLFKFPSGSINTGSAVASAVDMVSVAGINTTTLYSVVAKQLQ